MATESEDEQLEEKWLRLRAAIRMCLRPSTTKPLAEEFVPLYQLVFELTSVPRAPVLYLRLRSQLYAHARTCARIVANATNINYDVREEDIDGEAEETMRLMDEVVGNDDGTNTDTDITALERYAILWRAYTHGMRRIAAIFYYLDVHWVSHCRKHPQDLANIADPTWKTVQVSPVADLGLITWRDVMVSKVVPKLLENTQTIICTLRRKMVSTSKKHTKKKVGNVNMGETRCIRILLESIVAVGDTKLGGRDDMPKVKTDTFASVLEARPCCVYNKKTASLALYRALWEREFLAQAREFYSREANAALMSKDAKINDYVGLVANTGMEKELKFAQGFCHTSTIRPLRRVLEGELVSKRRNRLIAEADRLVHIAAAQSESFEDFQRNNQLDDLRQLFTTLKCVPDAAETIADALRRHATEAGSRAVKQIAGIAVDINSGYSDDNNNSNNSAEWKLIPVEEQSPPALFVYGAWAVYARLQAVVEHAFNSNVACQRALNQACERYVNSVDAAPALVAHFIHELLEGPAPRNATIDGHELETDNGNADVDVDEWAVQATRLFRFLADKRAFQRVYARRLAHRLIFNTSKSRAKETHVLDLLSQLCGNEYTSRLKRMFGDVDSSVKLTRDHKCALERRPNFEFNALVLSSGIWPKKRAGNDNSAEEREKWRMAFLALPNAIYSDIGVACDEFMHYYSDIQAHARRKLTWEYSKCRVWLSARVERTGDAGDTVLIEATLGQAAILLHLDSAENNVTQEEAYSTEHTLAQELGLAPELVSGAVRALVRAGVLVVTADDGSGSIEVAETIRTKRRNADTGGDKYGALRAALVVTDGGGSAAAEKEAEKRALGARDGDRRSQIAAAIVRTMKAEREMTEDALFEQTEEKIKAWFAPTRAELKRSIAGLVENEYLALSNGVCRYIV